MDSMHDDARNATENQSNAFPNESLPPFVAYQTGEDSRSNTPKSAGGAEQHYRHGRVEAEAHRVSDEVTRAAQQRLRAAQTSVVAAVTSTGNAATSPSVALAGVLPAPKLLKRICIPLDGTLHGERTIPYAAELARMTHAALLLAHVTPTEPPSFLGRLLHLEPTERQEAQQVLASEALPYLQRWQKQMDTAYSEAVDISHLTAPTVADGLIEIERSHSIDLVALALAEHGESDHMMLGNVVDRVVRLGSAPALVIPPEADAGVRPFALRHILVPLDGSPLAEEALAPLSGLLAQIPQRPDQQITVTLFGVAENHVLLREYEDYLEALRDALGIQPAWMNVSIQMRSVVGSAPGAIVGAVNHGSSTGHRGDSDEMAPVDMVVMSTHGLGGMKRWLFGSVAAYVLPRVTAPILVVHPTYLEDQ